MEKIFLRPVLTEDQSAVPVKDGQLVFDKTACLLYIDWQGKRFSVKAQ